jgi:transcriptional regulator with XRE-family HTH domain
MAFEADSERSPHPIDVHVGARIRLRRKFLRISQEKLADALGLTFQQVQKYERGANRVSASKLYEIARFLNAPVQYFFEGLTDAVQPGGEEDGHEQFVHGFLMTAEGIELASLFPKIKSPRLRRKVLDLVRELAETEDLPE